MTHAELLSKVEEINKEATARAIVQDIEDKETQILKLEIEIMELKVKKFKLLQDNKN